MSKHSWTYANIGGNVRVVIKNGKDIQHLAELDEKLWTVLSCPTSGLEIAEESLNHIDGDKDKKIHIKEVVETSQWLSSVLKNLDVLMPGNASLQLNDIKDESILAIANTIAVDDEVNRKGRERAGQSRTKNLQLFHGAQGRAGGKSPFLFFGIAV